MYNNKRAIICQPAKCHKMVFRWHANDGPTLRAGTIRLSSDTICIAIHAMRYNTYHDISTPTQLHLEVLFL